MWNVPHPKNPHFTGRHQLLSQVIQGSTSSQSSGVVTVVCGLDGVGKTQIAVEYAYRHANDYEAIWWIRASNKATLEADYGALAIAVGADRSCGARPGPT